MILPSAFHDTLAKVRRLEARVADLERTAACAEDMRDASDARVRELESAMQRLIDGHGADSECIRISRDEWYLFRRVIDPSFVGAYETSAPARLDADGTAKPLTEIVGVFPEGEKNFFSNAVRLVHREVNPLPRFCVGDIVKHSVQSGEWRVNYAGKHQEGHDILTVESEDKVKQFFDHMRNFTLVRVEDEEQPQPQKIYNSFQLNGPAEMYVACVSLNSENEDTFQEDLEKYREPLPPGMHYWKDIKNKPTEHCEQCGGTAHGKVSYDLGWNEAIEVAAKLFNDVSTFDWLCIDHGEAEARRIVKMIRGLKKEEA